ncbi:MAG: tRNA (mnm(5)s(2)U34)-methyltransferase [Acholeplasmataceae bacterium]
MKPRSMTLLSHLLLADLVKKKDVIVDATMGNGHDTLFLARICSYVYAFDIQDEALRRTRTLLDEHGITNVELIKDSHSRIPDYVQDFQGVIFNLGYLPKGSRELTTRSKTTIRALDRLLPLSDTGFILIVCYPGHSEGKRETEAVGRWLSDLDPRIYQVTTIHHPYQPNDPPLIHLVIGKKKDGT